MFGDLNGMNVFTSINYKNGLQSKDVFYGFQSKVTALYWFATGNGISRFDGVNFNSFERVNPYYGIPAIKALEDNKGNIWFFTNLNNIGYYDGNVFKTPSCSEAIKKTLLNSTIKDFWLSKNNEVFFYIQENLSKKILLFKIKLLKQNNFIIQTETITKIYNQENNLILYKYGNCYLSFFSAKYQSCFRKIPDLNIYFNENLIISLDSNLSQKIILKLKNGFISNLQIINSKMYVSTTNGVQVIDSKGGVKNLFDMSINVSSVFIDTDSNLFVTAQNEGIFVEPYFKISELNISSKYGYSNIKISKNKLIYSDKKYNLYIFDLTTNAYYKKLSTVESYSDKNIFVDNKSIFFNKSIIENYEVKSKPIKSNFIPFQKIRLFNDYYYIITGYADVKIVNRKYETISQLFYGTRVFDAKIDDENNLWIATKNNLVRCKILNYKTWKTTNFDTIINGFQIEKIQFCNNSTYCLINKKKLCKIDKRGVVYNLLIRSSISNKVINDYIIINNKLYVCTNSGLYIGQIEDDNSVFKSKLISPIDGFYTDEITGIDTLNGEMYFSTSSRVFKFKIKDIRFVEKNNPCILNSIKTNKKYINVNRKILSKNLSFDNDENSIEFVFVNSYLNKSNNILQYQYSLIFNNSTLLNNYSLSDNIRFENLKHGSYCLIVSSLDNNNIWGKPSKIHFKVNPRFSETILYFVFWVVISTIGLMFFIYIFMENRRRKSMLIKLNLENENNQLQLLKSQLNPHFLFNTLNSLKSLIYLDRKKQAIDYTDHLSGFLRSILNSNQELQTTIYNELELVRTYFYIEKIRIGEEINLILNCDHELNQIEIPSNIIQPIVENSFKHGYNNDIIGFTITISVIKKADVVEISVKDNSSKVKLSKETTTSFSLKAIQNRIDFFNKKSINNCMICNNVMRSEIKIGYETIIKIKLNI